MAMLGYTPLSLRGTKPNVAITVTPSDSPPTITIDKNTQFTSTVTEHPMFLYIELLHNNTSRM